MVRRSSYSIKTPNFYSTEWNWSALRAIRFSLTFLLGMTGEYLLNKLMLSNVDRKLISSVQEPKEFEGCINDDGVRFLVWNRLPDENGLSEQLLDVTNHGAEPIYYYTGQMRINETTPYNGRYPRLIGYRAWEEVRIGPSETRTFVLPKEAYMAAFKASFTYRVGEPRSLRTINAYFKATASVPEGCAEY